jgi:DNA-binding NtrC family response regulator
LRVIQDGEVRPVGGIKVVRVDVRIISATNVDLKESALHGRFREDLFYRLNGVTIRIPPLRERREDILLLADHFLDAFAKETGMERKPLSNESKKLLFSYAWPGNVRELENTMKNAFVISQGHEIQIGDFRYKTELFADMPGQGKMRADPSSSAGFRVEGENQNEKKNDPFRDKALKGGVEIRSLKESEREAIVHALERSRGKRKEAAELLDIPIRTLYEKIRRYGLK